MPILGRVVLPEAASAFEWYELFVHTNVSVWAEQHLEAVRPHIPDFADWSQFVVSGSGKFIIKAQRPGDVTESFFRHGRPKNPPSGFLTPKVGR